MPFGHAEEREANFIVAQNTIVCWQGRWSKGNSFISVYEVLSCAMQTTLNPALGTVQERQVKTKKRVEDHGEVFTAEREVNAMLDLVKQETMRIESRFLEPACGTGNFLVEVLRRKLVFVKSRYKKSQLEYERNAVSAISSIYGIDLLEDNVQECQTRLFAIFDEQYRSLYHDHCKKECRNSVRYILQRNILRGDALTLTTVGNGGEPITFSEWSAVNGSMIKRRDFTMANLLQSQPTEGLNLFSDLGINALIPMPIREFPLIHFLKLSEYA